MSGSLALPNMIHTLRGCLPRRAFPRPNPAVVLVRCLGDSIAHEHIIASLVIEFLL